MMFRGMQPDADGLPRVGSDSRRLGVRVPHDMRPDAAGSVHPGTGGMSVAPDSMWNVPNHRRPRGMLRGSTGPAADRIYAIDSPDVRSHSLDVRQTSPLHALIEPSVQMALAAYEAALVSTRPFWRQAWP